MFRTRATFEVFDFIGDVAQLVERPHRTRKVSGSTPLISILRFPGANLFDVKKATNGEPVYAQEVVLSEVWAVSPTKVSKDLESFYRGVAQLAERSRHMRKVSGSTPLASIIF